MKRKELIKVNIINLVILGLIALFWIIANFILDNSKDNGVSLWLSIILLAGWAGYAIYSNVSIIMSDETEEKKKFSKLRNRISRAGNLKFFVKEREQLVNLWDGVQSREKYFLSDERDERVRELYILTRNQMYRYVTDAADYLESYDYYSGKDSGYLKGVCDESQKLLDKFNKMVELSVSVDDEVLSYDTQEIDDMIEALEYMKNSGKNKLEI